MTNSTIPVPTISVAGSQGAVEAEILTPKGIEFLTALSTNFEAERLRLLVARVTRGEALRFLIYSPMTHRATHGSCSDALG